MTKLQIVTRRAGALLLAVVGSMALAAQAWAQTTQPVSVGGKGASPWVMPYALVIFCVGLGLLILCKPSKRREKAKAEK